jgi:hypothetical protein
MENIVDTLFGNFLSSIYFVDSNPAEVEMIEVKKINSEIKEFKKKESFNLFKKSIDNSGLPSLNIRENVKQNLISVMNYNSENSEFKYFKVGFFKGLFYKKDPKKILNLFKEKSDWIITSEDIISELSSLEYFEYMSGYGDIRLVGKIGETMIFKMKDIKNVIYIGKKESITAVFNRNLFQRKDDILVEYLLKANDRLEKIIVY